MAGKISSHTCTKLKHGKSEGKANLSRPKCVIIREGKRERERLCFSALFSWEFAYLWGALVL